MNQKFQYTTVETSIAKLHRETRGSGIAINESDVIEWIGEALGFMKIANVQEEAVAFVEVKNYQCLIPNGLHYIIQIARNNEPPEACNTQAVTSNISSSSTNISNGGENEDCLVPVDCQGNIIGDYNVAYYRPYFDLQYEYLQWYHSNYRREKFTPVRLSNHSFFNTLVCKEDGEDIYNSSRGDDEYTIAGDQLKFSFKEGFIALAYLRQRVDTETGYPMIPDDQDALNAVGYYLLWKLMEREKWSHREGSVQLSKDAELLWLKYVKQFKNKAMMPTGVDQHQNLMEQSRYLIPRLNRYYGFFGSLGKKEQRVFSDPAYRNKLTQYRGYGGI